MCQCNMDSHLVYTTFNVFKFPLKMYIKIITWDSPCQGLVSQDILQSKTEIKHMGKTRVTNVSLVHLFSFIHLRSAWKVAPLRVKFPLKMYTNIITWDILCQGVVYKDTFKSKTKIKHMGKTTVTNVSLVHLFSFIRSRSSRKLRVKWEFLYTCIRFVYPAKMS